jgi:hypothetical protein
METDITLILRTLTPIVEVLDQLALPYHVGGSVASSLYGQFRPTQDVDIVADIRLSHAHLFAKLLEGGLSFLSFSLSCLVDFPFFSVAISRIASSGGVYGLSQPKFPSSKALSSKYFFCTILS